MRYTLKALSQIQKVPRYMEALQSLNHSTCQGTKVHAGPGAETDWMGHDEALADNSKFATLPLDKKYQVFEEAIMKGKVNSPETFHTAWNIFKFPEKEVKTEHMIKLFGFAIQHHLIKTHTDLLAYIKAVGLDEKTFAKTVVDLFEAKRIDPLDVEIFRKAGFFTNRFVEWNMGKKEYCNRLSPNNQKDVPFCQDLG